MNSFYTAPTAIRTLMKYDLNSSLWVSSNICHRYEPEFVNKYDLSSLRVLGSVGEPLNPEVSIAIT